MKARTMYTCEICHTDYADKENAQKCEKSHVKPMSIWKNIKYHSIYNGRDPIFRCSDTNYPDWIDVQFENGKTVRYKK